MPTCEISTSWMRKASSTCSAASSCDTVQGTMLCERLRCRGWGEGGRAAVSDRLSSARLGSAQLGWVLLARCCPGKARGVQGGPRAPPPRRDGAVRGAEPHPAGSFGPPREAGAAQRGAGAGEAAPASSRPPSFLSSSLLGGSSPSLPGFGKEKTREGRERRGKGKNIYLKYLTAGGCLES